MAIVYTPAERKPEPLDLHAMKVGETRVFSNYEENIHRIRAYISIAKRMHGAIVECREEPGSFGLIYYHVTRTA